MISLTLARVSWPLDRFLWLKLAMGFWLAWVTSGCGGCGGTTEGICPTEVACGLLERCVQGQCVALSDVVCTPGCGGGEVCEKGECIKVVSVCTQARQNCDRQEPFSGEFVCLDWDGFNQGEPAQCSTPCATGGTCPTGEICFGLGGLGTTQACDPMTPCPSGHLCQQGRCQAAACRPSECSGVLSGQKKCDEVYGKRPGFKNGTQCVEGQNETRFCFQAGTKKLGEQCIDTEQGVGEERFDQMCANGLACIQGRCLTACATKDVCGQEETCLFATEDLVGKGVGFCGKECAAFSRGECGEAGKCLPVDAQKGYCVPAGKAVAFASCTPLQWQCEEGTLCNELAQDQGRCMPLCNLTVAPMDPEAPVTRADQIQRDATCPQAPDVAYAYVRLAHLATAAGPLEVRVDREVLLPSLAPSSLGEREESEPPGARGVLIVPPGQHVLGFYDKGADPLAPALLEQSFSVGRDALIEVVVIDAPESSSERLAASLLSSRPSGSSPAARLGNFLSGPITPGLSVRLIDSSTLAGATRALPPKDEFVPLMGPGVGPGATVDVAILNGQEVVYERKGIVATAGVTLYLTGTLDPQDARPLGLTALPVEVLPPLATTPPYMVCNELGNPTFGLCQETCATVDEYATNRCQGDGMGCTPQQIEAPPGWQSVCAPGGAARLGERCDPSSQVPQCVFGAHCLEYGNADPQVAAGAKRGVCTPLCDTRGGQVPVLACGASQVCVPLAPGALDVGRCQFKCEPGTGYGDASCPPGLRSCKPAAALVEDQGVTGEQVPQVVALDAVCSASGSLAKDATCAGADCVPGTECLYPRSAQSTLISTLLSPYFGAQSLVPTCRAQCDPFDQTMSVTRCGPQETCLMNFPWSADVGHCTPIVERAEPMQACTRPGESCGEDSVCILDGESPLCLRLCEYTGGLGGGVFNRSSCPGGLECAPFVNDVGICR